MNSASKKIMQYICAAMLIAALTWIAVGETPLAVPPERPYDYQIEPPAPVGPSLTGITDPAAQGEDVQQNPNPQLPWRPNVTYSQQETATQGNNSSAATATNQNSATSKNTSSAPKTSSPASTLPNSATKAEAVRIYQQALSLAKSASGFKAQKSETANMNIHTGETVEYLAWKINVDDFFHDFVGNPRSSSYQYGSGTWALRSERNVMNLMNNKQENRAYAEYGNKSSVAYNDKAGQGGQYWNLKPVTKSGLTPSALTSLLRQNDVLKMSKSAAPSSFLPPASFSSNDVIAYNYNKNANGTANLTINLSASAINNAMILPDTKAIKAQPYEYDASFIKITMSFPAIVTQWQNARLEMTLNAQGYPTSIKQSSSLGGSSSCTMSLSCSIKSLSIDSMTSAITGDYNVSWTLSGWNKNEKPASPW